MPNKLPLPFSVCTGQTQSYVIIIPENCSALKKKQQMLIYLLSASVFDGFILKWETAFPGPRQCALGRNGNGDKKKRQNITYITKTYTKVSKSHLVLL